MRRIVLSFVVFLALTACSISINGGSDSGSSKNNTYSSSSSDGDADSGFSSEKDTYRGINLGTLPNYRATYTIVFEGDYTWRYTLVTRYDWELTEYSLNVQGVDAANNPGDIRLVTDGETSWMTGPGTDNECYKFPADLDLGFSFLTPDSLLLPYKITALLSSEGKEKVAGIQTAHYAAEVDTLGGLSDLQIDLWLSDEKTALLYTLQATGEDPMFNAGEGRLTAKFEVNEIASQEIELVTGCEINFPLPGDAEQVVRFPQMVSYETRATPEYIVNYYQTYLLEEGWVVANPLITTDKGFQMSFSRGDEVVILILTVEGETVKVQILEQ